MVWNGIKVLRLKSSRAWWIGCFLWLPHGRPHKKTEPPTATLNDILEPLRNPIFLKFLMSVWPPARSLHRHFSGSHEAVGETHDRQRWDHLDRVLLFVVLLMRLCILHPPLHQWDQPADHLHAPHAQEPVGDLYGRWTRTYRLVVGIGWCWLSHGGRTQHSWRIEMGNGLFSIVLIA